MVPTMDNPSTTSGPPATGSNTLTDQLAAGLRMEREGRCADALDLYNRLLTVHPHEGRLHYRAGCAALKMGEAAKAQSSFEVAVEQDPRNPRYLTNLGVALDRQGRREDAVRLYKRTALLDGGTVVAHHNLGAIYAEQGRMDEALRSFRAAIALEPDAEGYHNLGLVHFRADDFVAALESFRNAVACDSSYAVGHYYVGLCLMKTGNYTAAMEAFQRAWDLDARLARVPYHLGCCLHKLQRYEEARSRLEQALDAFPEDGRLHYQLALTCDALGLHPEARVHYGMASGRRNHTE